MKKPLINDGVGEKENGDRNDAKPEVDGNDDDGYNDNNDKNDGDDDDDDDDDGNYQNDSDIQSGKNIYNNKSKVDIKRKKDKSRMKNFLMVLLFVSCSLMYIIMVISLLHSLVFVSRLHKHFKFLLTPIDTQSQIMTSNQGFETTEENHKTSSKKFFLKKNISDNFERKLCNRNRQKEFGKRGELREEIKRKDKKFSETQV